MNQEINFTNNNAWLVRFGEEARLDGYVLKYEGGGKKEEGRRMKYEEKTWQ